MKIIHLLSIAFLASVSIYPKHDQQSRQIGMDLKKESPGIASGNVDSTTWNSSFLKFKEAILSNIHEKVKSFIDFPIRNEGNEIWYLSDSRLVMQIDSHKIVPFMEADFDKYYSSIFTIVFRRTLEKLPDDEFFRKESASSTELVIIKGSTSRLTAIYNKTNHKLDLKLITTFTHPDGGKYIIDYQFEVLKDQEVKFKSVHVTS